MVTMIPETVQKDLGEKDSKEGYTQAEKRHPGLAAFLKNSKVSNALPEPCVRVSRAAILRNLEDRWIHNIDDSVRRILCIGASDMNSVFEFELLSRWVT
jgi:hypothetical protein